MNLFLSPAKPNIDPKTSPINGVEQVVLALHKYLPNHVDLVSNPLSADLLAAHVVPFADLWPDVLHNHGVMPTANYDFTDRVWKLNARVIDAIRHAKVVTVPSPWVAEIFLRDMHMQPVVIPHGIHLDEWPEPVNGAKKRRVIWNKNRLGGVCDPKPLTILAGIHSNIQFITTFGRKAKNVEVTGLVPFEKMKEILYEGGVYLSTTKETFGIGILEAMAAGLPVLAWNWGNASELIKHKVTGYLVNPGDYEATGAGIQFCLNNYEKLSKAARGEALKHSWIEIIPKYVDVYHQALKAHTGPTVSIIITCYNYARFIADAINSVKKQSFEDFECIIINDGSTDDSLSVIENNIKDDARFRVIDQPNAKVAKARNRGAIDAKGEYLCFLDADDILKEDFIESLLPPLFKDRSIGISYGMLDLFTHKGQRQGAWPGDANFDKQLRGDNQVPACNLIRKSAFFRAGGYKSHTIPAEDAELWTNIGLVGYSAVKATDNSVVSYRFHEQSATAKIRAKQEDEPDWLKWVAAAKGGPQPFASIATPERFSHPVRDYEKPLVSIIIPVGKDHKEHVTNAIESVVAQTDPRWELIVVDDTGEGLKHYGVIPYHRRYPFIHWRKRRKIGNVSGARNLGASHARGEFLLFLDADDELDRNFLKCTLKVAEQRPQSIIYTDWVSLPENKVHKAEAWDFDALKKQALFVVTFLHPKEAFDAVGGFNESIPVWEDWDYSVQLAHKGYYGVHVPLSLFLYHYESGTRREECLTNAKELMAEFRENYKDLKAEPRKELGLLIQPDDPILKVLVEQHIVTEEETFDKVLIRYTGNNSGARTFRTPLGHKYRFDGKRSREIWIPKIDSHFFERMLDFIAVRRV